VRTNVFHYRTNLGRHQIGCEMFHSLHSESVLDCDQREDSFAIHAELVKSFQVGLNTSAPAGVRARNGQSYWSAICHIYRMASMAQEGLLERDSLCLRKARRIGHLDIHTTDLSRISGHRERSAQQERSTCGAAIEIPAEVRCYVHP
jgi:hypothetical protein